MRMIVAASVHRALEGLARPAVRQRTPGVAESAGGQCSSSARAACLRSSRRGELIGQPLEGPSRLEEVLAAEARPFFIVQDASQTGCTDARASGIRAPFAAVAHALRRGRRFSREIWLTMQSGSNRFPPNTGRIADSGGSGVRAGAARTPENHGSPLTHRVNGMIVVAGGRTSKGRLSSPCRPCRPCLPSRRRLASPRQPPSSEPRRPWLRW
jgi:hypothetical protein